MFRTSIAGRTTRALAAGALILSLTATTFAGLASAAPQGVEGQNCSEAAHARNDALHLLHTAWKAFNSDLQSLARDTRKLQHEALKAGDAVTKDARAEVASSKQELMGIRSLAQSDIQGAADLGTACKDEADDTTSTTGTTTTTTTTTTSATAPSDATAPADSTDGARSFDTSGLDDKYKDIVDQAILDMQAVVDDARQAVLELTAVGESTATTEDVKVKKDLETVKADNEKAKHDREDARNAEKAKTKSKGGKPLTTDKGDAKPANKGGGHDDSKGRD
jgi:hypothetical protein